MAFLCFYVTFGNNAAEGENKIKYASSYPMNWTKWRIDLHKILKAMVTTQISTWSDYDEDNVPFERLEKVYVLSSSFFVIKSRSES